MRVTIHQPEHFPYMGFFQKLETSDMLIVLDNVKFRKNYFQNRNKIKTSSGKDEWITVPVPKKSSSLKIKDVVVSQDGVWKQKLLKTIYQNFKFDASDIYSSSKLMDINMASIKWAMNKMNLERDIVFASHLQAEGSKSLLLANLVKEAGGTTYISGPSGKNYLDTSFFTNIEVEYFEPQVKNYYSCLYNLLAQEEQHE